MNIAILGLGTVGFGVYDIIENKKKIKDTKVVRILDRTLNKINMINSPIITTNYLDILNDKSIDVIIETMGAGDYSYDCIKKALKSKKHVITANKEVIALHLEELTKIKDENGVSLYFEASVGGGIPIIVSLEEVIKTNEVSEIVGILNGTTNFILTKVFHENMSFKDALKLAQELGFAESDPTADLEGLDMVRKIAILSSIAYHSNININDVYHFGITNLSDEDVKFIKNQNYILKLIASSLKNDNKVNLEVEPVLLSNDNIFSSVNNEFNLVEVNADLNGLLSFYGKGAGRYPTANAICNDLIRIIEKEKNPSFKSYEKLEVVIRKAEKYYLNVKDISKVNSDIIDYRVDNYIITKSISRDIFLKLLDNVNFYARIQN